MFVQVHYHGTHELILSCLMDVKNNNKLLMAFCVYSWTNMIVRATTTAASASASTMQKKITRTYREEWTFLYPLIFIYNVNTTTSESALTHSVSVYDNDDDEDDDDYIIQWLNFPNNNIYSIYSTSNRI